MPMVLCQLVFNMIKAELLFLLSCVCLEILDALREFVVD